MPALHGAVLSVLVIAVWLCAVAFARPTRASQTVCIRVVAVLYPLCIMNLLQLVHPRRLRRARRYFRCIARSL